jgi:hypothetical protein
MVATCAKNSIPPVAPKSYVDAVGVTHCLSASSIRIYLHMEQIYEIAGMPRMATVDTLRDQNNVNSISIADLILSKIGNTCQGGSTQNNGICMGCPANCGGPRCTACTGGQVSADGTITCHN